MFFSCFFLYVSTKGGIYGLGLIPRACVIYAISAISATVWGQKGGVIFSYFPVKLLLSFQILGGGNSNIFNFHPDPWGK